MNINTQAEFALDEAGCGIYRVAYLLHRENRENGPQKIPVRDSGILPKHRENTGHFVCSSSKFPISKGKGYCDIFCKNFHSFLVEAGYVCQVSFV